MLKKTMTYTDYNGETVTEDFYFNLSKAELIELELSEKDGFAEALQRIIASEDRPKLIAEFKRLILTAYGVKSADGKRFEKSQELRDAFAQTEAYSDLFFELATNTDAAVGFINAIVPKGMSDQELATVELPEPSQEQPAWIKENRDPTKKELASMTAEQLREVFQRKANS